MSAWVMEPLEALTELELERGQLVRLLDRSEILRSTLRLLVDGTSAVAWIAEPGSSGALELRHVLGDHTRALRGFQVPDGLGLTGKVRRSLAPDWVNDYFAADSITHNFDRPVREEGVARLLAVPLFGDACLAAC
jgi:hypothetical protein